MSKNDFGLIGVGLMGENLTLNIESKGFSVSVFDIAQDKINKFISGRAKDKKITGCNTLEDLIQSLKTPRKIMLMVQAGKPVDDVIEKLVPLMEEGDIVIDGGNTHFPDTNRRVKYLESKGFRYIGTGVSGGEEGALLGPSIMPGGSTEAWAYVKPIFQAISAKVDTVPCCEWIGEEGAGHFVKMVHNGIEYGDMQLICEVYHFMREVLEMTPDEMRKVFSDWNKGELSSYLIEITAEILSFKDKDGKPLIDKILDKAGQKGTGKWTAITSMDLSTALTLITESVYARIISSMKTQRVENSKKMQGPKVKFAGNKAEMIESLGKALYTAKILSYTQGYELMAAAAKEFNWKLNYGGIAMIWRGGCIIRSVFLGKIKDAFEKNPDLRNLILDPFFNEKINSNNSELRKVVVEAVKCGIPVPALSSALAYYDGIRTENLPANLLQAQRDYFGAHQYERVDKPKGEFFHTNWTGRGGETASSVYNV